MAEVPKNISKEDILQAISEIDEKGIPPRAHSSTYDIVHEGKRYPPKLVVSIANRFANGEELDRSTFGGALNKDAFKLLESNGFTIDTKQDQFEKAYLNLREYFLKDFPDFEGFGLDKDYIATERGYKDDLIEIYQRDARPLLDSKNWSSAGIALRDLLTTKLPSINKPQNIVGWRYIEPINNLDEDDLSNFGMEVANLVDEALPLDQRIEQFLNFFSAMPETNQLQPAATRSIVSFYLTVNDPNRYLFLKTQEIARILKRFDPKFSWEAKHIKANEIEYVNDVAGRLFERLDEEGWEPKDLVDVQSFLWAAESASSRKENGAEIELVQSWIFRVKLSELEDADHKVFTFDLALQPGLRKFYHKCTADLRSGDIAIFIEEGTQGMVNAEAIIDSVDLNEDILNLSVNSLEVKNVEVESQTNHQTIVPGLYTTARHSHGAANIIQEYFDKDRDCFVLNQDSEYIETETGARAVNLSDVDRGNNIRWFRDIGEIKVGSPVYLITQVDDQGRAIFAKGRALTNLFSYKASETKEEPCVILGIEDQRMNIESGLIPQSVLEEDFPNQVWESLDSAVIVEKEYKSGLHGLWGQLGHEEVYEPTHKVNSKMDTVKNQILYGPPGTGKTYHTVNKALKILDPSFYEANKSDRSTLKRRFDELKAKGRIDFVTFHQSFSYEDFVEGLRASTDENGQIHYEIEDGIFKRMCDAAAAKVQIESHQTVDVTDRRIWKMSLGNTTGSESYVYDDCINNDQLLLGYGGYIDFSRATDRKAIAERFLEGGEELGEHDYAVTAVNTFVNQMMPGDLVVVTDGNHKFRAIGEIAGDYEYLSDQDHSRDWYWQSRPVKWHRTYSPSLPSDQLMNKAFSQMTLYELRPQSIDMDKLQSLLDRSSPTQSAHQRPFKEGEIIKGKYSVERVSPELLQVRKPNGSVVPFTWEMLDELVGLIKSGQLQIDDIGKPEIFDNIDTRLEKYIVNGYNNIIPSIINRLIEDGPEATLNEEARPDAWVLIIDEINRGNIANILGELITLIEPSKRAGAEEAIEVALPYSKTKFSVPDNLYIIGTMNTADRSLVHIDTALRRRFQFEAMLPDIGVLNELGIQDVEGIDIQKMLRTLNSRIELLYDKEHTLGHSFFIPLRSNPNLATLSRIFENQIMPLLEEYFFEDWSRIQQILGDDIKLEDDLRFYVPAFEPNEIESLLGGENNQVMHDKAFKRNEQALHRVEAFIGIYEQPAVSG